MADVGYWALVLTLVVSAYAVVASIVGAQRRSGVWLESARNAVFTAAAAATVACGLLLVLLMQRDFAVRYVYEHVSNHLPDVYAFSSLWAGSEGSLLLWLWLLTAMTTAMVVVGQGRHSTSGPYVLATMAFAQAFLSLVLVLVSNPFELLPSVPVEGRGLNPLLQNAWMVVHPPVVFCGYAAYTAPFALAVGGLVTGQLGEEWLQSVRRWALFAWLFLGTGILMGAWWAYLELGWGGYWGWDPVENSSLIPWLTGTALLHSLMMQQRRSVLKVWNLWLVGLTFTLCMFATFITRSGIIQSVHAFGRSVIGYSFLAFIVICLLALAGLLTWRRRALGTQYDLQEILSRETSLLVTNLLLLGAALVVLVGTLFPALVEVVQGRQAALDVSFYERAVGPLLLGILGLLGACPLLAWGGSAPDRLRRGLLVPAVAAVVVLALLFVVGIRRAVALVSFAICAFVGLSLLAMFYRGTLGGRQRTGEIIPLAFLRMFVTNRRRYGAHIVHLGIVLIAVGVTGSSIYQDEVQVALAPGERIDVRGYGLVYRDFVSEELPDRQRFTAVVDLQRGDRRIATLRPQKDFHWNVEQWVTEVAIHSTLKHDLYLILAGFEADGLASFRVLINPLVIWLWIGGAGLLAGGVLAWWPAAPKGSRQ
jgi:cytochrome c-type biogenesis protein CcmF